jgi:quercetin dioxygenase-like cupin family protein
MGATQRPILERDPVKLDPKHYKVELETDRLRIVRVRYGPSEKSPMHQHLPGLTVMLTDGDFKFTYPDGCTEEIHKKAGEFHSFEVSREHQAQNLAKKVFKGLIVELKK